MLTHDDLIKMQQIFATKEALHDMESRLASKEELRDIKGILESLAGDIKDKRQEQQVHAQRHDDIESDLRTIKSVPIIAHELKKKK